MWLNAFGRGSCVRGRTVEFCFNLSARRRAWRRALSNGSTRKRVTASSASMAATRTYSSTSPPSRRPATGPSRRTSGSSSRSRRARRARRLSESAPSKLAPASQTPPHGKPSVRRRTYVPTRRCAGTLGDGDRARAVDLEDGQAAAAGVADHPVLAGRGRDRIYGARPYGRLTVKGAAIADLVQLDGGRAVVVEGDRRRSTGRGRVARQAPAGELTGAADTEDDAGRRVVV